MCAPFWKCEAKSNVRGNDGKGERRPRGSELVQQDDILVA